MHTQRHAHIHPLIFSHMCSAGLQQAELSSPLGKALNKPVVAFPMTQEDRTDPSLTGHSGAWGSTGKRRKQQNHTFLKAFFELWPTSQALQWDVSSQGC